MAHTTLVHIVPTVPPAFNGLADYCFKLWQHWAAPRPAWHCLAARVPPGAQEAWPQAEISSFSPDKNGLLSALERAAPACVVLHYVGYAYQKRGIPLGLAPALRAWKARSGGRVCVMFHETYASGSPRSSAFWLTPIARNIAIELARLADSWVTSNEAAAAHLVHGIGADARRGRLIPVGSNVEPNAPIDYERPWPLAGGEKLRVAVFGLPHNRVAVLKAHRHLLRQLCQNGMVQTINLIGKSHDGPSAELREIQEHIAPDGADLWRSFPDLAPAPLSDVLRNNDLSLSRNSPGHLTKSGSYAAACLHGLVTICAPDEPHSRPASGLHGAEVAPPFRANDDARAAQTLEWLRDFEAVETLRAQVKTAARGRLSWPEIVREWQEVVAL